MPGLVGLAGAWAHRVGYSVFLVPTLLAFALFTGRPLLTAVLESEWMLPVSGLRAFPRAFWTSREVQLRSFSLGTLLGTS